MSEIKLVIILLLAICNFLLLKSQKKKQQPQEQSNQLIVQEQQNVKLQQESSINKLCEDHSYLIDQQAIQKFTDIEASLFNQQTIRTEEKHSTINNINTEILDCNDIFGDQYSKCIKGKTMDLDDNPIFYNNDYFEQKIFPTKYNDQRVYTNQSCIEKIRSLIQCPRYSTKSFPTNYTFNPQVYPENLNKANDQYSTPFKNPYKDFSLKMEFQEEPMEEENSHNNEIEQKSIFIKKTKKKHIVKQAKTYRQRQDSSTTLSKLNFSPERKHNLKRVVKKLPSKASKGKTLICLEDEIKKKEKQLQVLRQLHKSYAPS